MLRKERPGLKGVPRRAEGGGIVIVGAGLAGLFTALKLAPMPVTVVSVSPFGQGGSSVWAQAGIAAALSEPRDAIEEIIEPYLLQQGFIARTPRGRMLTAAAFTHLGLPASAQSSAQFPLFNGSEEP